MSTRGAWGIDSGGEYIVIYNHMDSYPDDLGREVIELTKQGVDWSSLAGKIIIGASTRKPSEEVIEYYKEVGLIDEDYDVKDWYDLLHRIQKPTEYFLREPDLFHVLNVSKGWLEDSLSCEYGYIINLDENVLEYWAYGVLRKKFPLDEIKQRPTDDIVREMEALVEE